MAARPTRASAVCGGRAQASAIDKVARASLKGRTRHEETKAPLDDRWW